MTQEQIIEYNKLCAEFLGWEIHPTNPAMMQKKGIAQGYRTLSDFMYIGGLKFHDDWNWIRTVIGKISELYEAGIYYKECEIYNYTIFAEITEVFEECIKFIKWYNNNHE